MTKMLQRIPFIRLLIPFCLGISYQYIFQYTWTTGGFILSGCILLLSLIPKFNHYSFRYLFGISISSFCFFGSAHLTQNSLKLIDEEMSDTPQHYIVKLTGEPVMKPKTVRWEGIIKEENKKVLIYMTSDSIANNAEPGDMFIIYALFNKPENSPNGTFDYADYLRKQGISGIAYVSSKNRKKLTQTSLNLKDYALSYRKKLLKELHRLLPEERSFSLAAALILGYRQALDKELQITFSSTGASHVLAVSGLHTGILYGSLTFILSILGRSPRIRYIRQLIILPVIWVFAFLTGLSPSVVRAASMITLVGIGELIGRKSITVNTIGASAFLMLLYNPLYFFDVGFQLSYSAVFAIVLFNPVMTGLYKTRNTILNYIWELSCVSISAQIGTAPLAIYYFQQFPIVFLLTNLFVIPLSGILLMSLFFSLILGLLFSIPADFFKPVRMIVNFFIEGVEQIEKMPYVVLTGLSLDIPGVFFLYLSFIFIFFLCVHKKIIYICLLLLLVALSIIYYL